MKANRRLWSTVVVSVIAVVATLVSPATGALSAVSGAMTPRTADKPAQVRVNQVGYPAAGPKVAFAMLPRKVAAVRFEVITPYGVAYRGTSTRDLGSWNSGYQAVYQLSFTGLRLPGQYQVKLLSPAVAVSPEFIIGDGTQLYGPRAA